MNEIEKYIRERFNKYKDDFLVPIIEDDNVKIEPLKEFGMSQFKVERAAFNKF